MPQVHTIQTLDYRFSKELMRTQLVKIIMRGEE